MSSFYALIMNSYLVVVFFSCFSFFWTEQMIDSFLYNLRSKVNWSKILWGCGYARQPELQINQSKYHVLFPLYYVAKKLWHFCLLLSRQILCGEPNQILKSNLTQTFDSPTKHCVVPVYHYCPTKACFLYSSSFSSGAEYRVNIITTRALSSWM